MSVITWIKLLHTQLSWKLYVVVNSREKKKNSYTIPMTIAPRCTASVTELNVHAWPTAVIALFTHPSLV